MSGYLGCSNWACCENICFNVSRFRHVKWLFLNDRPCFSGALIISFGQQNYNDIREGKMNEIISKRIKRQKYVTTSQEVRNLMRETEIKT